MRLVAGVALFATLVVALAGAAGREYSHAEEPPANSSDEFVRPFPIVGIPRGASDAQKAAAKQIAKAIGAALVTESDRNPVCCVWMEVSGWVPNPGVPGYYIINQGGGSIISATDDDQLAKAVERFKKSLRKAKTGVEVPVGMMTNYHIIQLRE